MQGKSLAILLAIYEPREDWLIELLDSLNAQTYSYRISKEHSPSFSASGSISRLRVTLSSPKSVILREGQLIGPARCTSLNPMMRVCKNMYAANELGC